MERPKHERILCGNEQLRGLLKSVEAAADGTGKAAEADLESASERLSNSAFSVGEASRRETLDGDLRGEIGKYVTNLRALQTALEKAGRTVRPGPPPCTTAEITAEGDQELVAALQGSNT